jgi:hypothetical protein
MLHLASGSWRRSTFCGRGLGEMSFRRPVDDFWRLRSTGGTDEDLYCKRCLASAEAPDDGCQMVQDTYSAFNFAQRAAANTLRSLAEPDFVGAQTAARQAALEATAEGLAMQLSRMLERATPRLHPSKRRKVTATKLPARHKLIEALSRYEIEPGMKWTDPADGTCPACDRGGKGA